jgi:hypothetical protein
MAVTPTKGKDTYCALGTSGSETDVSGYVKNSSANPKLSTADTTTYGNGGFESSTPTVQGRAIQLSGIWNETIDGILSPLVAVEDKSGIWGPAGNASGKPKISGSGYLTKYDIKSDAKGINTFDAEFTFSGTVTVGTFA